MRVELSNIAYGSAKGDRARPSATERAASKISAINCWNLNVRYAPESGHRSAFALLG